MGLTEDVKGSASWEATQGQLDFFFLYFSFQVVSFCFARTPVLYCLVQVWGRFVVLLGLFACVPDRFLDMYVLEGLMDSIDHDNGDD